MEKLPQLRSCYLPEKHQPKLNYFQLSNLLIKFGHSNSGVDPITYYHVQKQIQLIKAEFYGELQGIKQIKMVCFTKLKIQFFTFNLREFNKNQKLIRNSLDNVTI